MKFPPFFTAFLPFTILAWNNRGHYIIGQIAYNQLAANNPGVLRNVEALLGSLGDVNPRDPNLFIEATVWGDEIKHLGWSATRDWHFNSRSYAPDGRQFTSRGEPLPAPAQNNIVWAMKECYKTLQTSRKVPMTLLVRVFALRMLMHMVGDITQPFHNISVFDEQFPDGGRSGSRFYVLVSGFETNLNLLWNAQVTLDYDLGVPLSQTYLNEVYKAAKDLQEKYPFERMSEELREESFDKWSDQSHLLAIEWWKKSGKVGESLSNEYITEGNKVAQKQIVLAAYRLVIMLKKLFPADDTPKVRSSRFPSAARSQRQRSSSPKTKNK